ncbi:MAG: DUF2292 domain-containing protein [Candidatus Cloacimonetes bacterium]|nr:DUF2292 domain-containing protein [Candidatus Cloacimonadota bacterium]
MRECLRLLQKIQFGSIQLVIHDLLYFIPDRIKKSDQSYCNRNSGNKLRTDEFPKNVLQQFSERIIHQTEHDHKKYTDNRVNKRASDLDIECGPGQ